MSILCAFALNFSSLRREAYTWHRQYLVSNFTALSDPEVDHALGSLDPFNPSVPAWWADRAEVGWAKTPHCGKAILC